jgi:hypothetical protein
MVRPGIGAVIQARRPPLGIGVEDSNCDVRTDRISGDGPDFWKWTISRSPYHLRRTHCSVPFGEDDARHTAFSTTARRAELRLVLGPSLPVASIGR